MCWELLLLRRWGELVLAEPDATPTLVGMLVDGVADATEDIMRSEVDEVTW